MKVAIFVDQFPVLSQTFVINQITGLIDLGIDVAIIAITKGKALEAIHPIIAQYGLMERTTFLNEEPRSKFKKLLYRIANTTAALSNMEKTRKIFTSLHFCYGQHGRSLLLASIIAKQKKVAVFDVILCHFGYNGILANKLRQLGVLEGKIATIFHGYEISASKALKSYHSDYLSLFNDTELMLPISSLWKEKLLEIGCPPNKIVVHRMGVDLNSFIFKATKSFAQSGAIKDNNKVFTLFTVARFTEKKGLEYAIKAIALLPDSVNVRYIIAGYGELETQLRTLVEHLGLKNQIAFIGAVNQETVIDYMKGCDAFLQPSITAQNGDMEGVPVSLMEAMAMGVPVISTYHSGIPEIITNGVTGLLSPEKDEQSLRDNIVKLSEDKVLRTNMIQNARHQVETMADVNTLNKELVIKLKTLLDRT
ncbi:glycosyltransferase [Thalassotalea piscium]